MLHTLNMSERAIYFVQIGQSVAKIWSFFWFFKMAAVRHLGFVIRVFGPHTKWILAVSVTVQIGLNRSSSFDNMQVLIFSGLSLKMPIEAHFGDFWR